MFQTFEQFLATSSVKIPLLWFIIDLVLTFFLSLSLDKIYSKYGNSISNRQMFGKNFILISMTTMLIITVVKSSLAISLGLVGALSIIRFRAAIKEPEELAYMFLAISIGLGLGANQRMVTIAALLIIFIIIIFMKRINQVNNENQNLFLTISGKKQKDINIKNIIKILNENCDHVKLNRFEETSEILEVSFLVEFNNVNKMDNAKNEIQKLDKKLTFSFIENKGIY